MKIDLDRMPVGFIDEIFILFENRLGNSSHNTSLPAIVTFFKDLVIKVDLGWRRRQIRLEPPLEDINPLLMGFKWRIHICKINATGAIRQTQGNTLFLSCQSINSAS